MSTHISIEKQTAHLEQNNTHQSGTMDFDSLDHENAEGYGPGGYHPVHLGDEFNNRYLVEHKLGFGTYATVWLARDLWQKRYVALKIVVARTRSEEGQFLRRLGSDHEQKGWLWSIWCYLRFWRRSTPTNSLLFPILLDEFTIHGPNGSHQCLVTEILGPSVRSLLSQAERLPLKVTRRVSVQVAQAVAKLHECGIVHGDLHTGNVLFCIPGVESWTPEQVYTYFGEPKTRNSLPTDRSSQISLGPQVPQYFVCAPSAKKLMQICLATATVRVIDFGGSFLSHPEGVDKRLGIPVAVAAPEVLFLDVVTPASDIWSLACFIFRIIGDHSLWDSMNGCLDDVLVHLTTTYGKLPERWWHKWRNRTIFFEEDGRVREDMADLLLTDDMDLKAQVTNGLLEDGAVMDLEEEEMAEFARLMLAMCKLEPEERITAKEVLQLLPACWTVMARNS